MFRLGGLIVLGAASLFCLSCQSKTVRGGNSSGQKATRVAGPLYSIALEAHVDQSPREAQALESKVILHPAVQSCLRAGVMNSGDSFIVTFGGQVSDSGQLDVREVESQYEPLKPCLQTAIGTLTLGSGPAGPFKMHVNRALTSGTTVKSFLLDMNEPKKLQ